MRVHLSFAGLECLAQVRGFDQSFVRRESRQAHAVSRPRRRRVSPERPGRKVRGRGRASASFIAPQRDLSSLAIEHGAGRCMHHGPPPIVFGFVMPGLGQRTIQRAAIERTGRIGARPERGAFLAAEVGWPQPCRTGHPVVVTAREKRRMPSMNRHVSPAAPTNESDRVQNMSQPGQ